MIKKPNIYVMSDLHFDTKKLSNHVKKKLKGLASDPLSYSSYKEKISKSAKHTYSKEVVEQNIEYFISLLNANKENNIFILAGDFFDDLLQTLDFINVLETEEIMSFVVLGNHDYWSKTSLRKRSWEESITIASEATKNNKYCRLLVTGRKYRIDNLIFIGDTGFTSLKYMDWKSFPNYNKTATIEDLRQIVPDVTQIKNFSTDNIRQLHKRWVDFARKEIQNLSGNDSLFIITHWPMDYKYEDIKTASMSWWKTNANFPKVTPKFDIIPKKEEKYWLISGHTHSDSHEANSISVQAGYRNEKWFRQLRLSDFGLLSPTEKLYALVDSSNALSTFVDFAIIEQGEDFLELSIKVKQSGYRRAGNWGNKKVLMAYLEDSKSYLKQVKKEISGINNEFIGNVGYSDILGPQIYRSKLAIQAAIDVLKAGYQNNPFEFFTALIVSGYAYNHATHLLYKMRKINVYDIIRQSMVFLTIMKIPELDVNDIRSIKAQQGKNSSINIGNLEIKIPVIDGHKLNLEAFLPMANDFNMLLLGEEQAEQKRLQLENKIHPPAKSVQKSERKIKKSQKQKSKKVESSLIQVFSKETPLDDLPNIYKEKRRGIFVYTVDKTIDGIRHRKRFKLLEDAIDFLNELNQFITK